jgi:hypothetical protein
MIKILAIGNSFSEDATAYLYDIAKAGNTEIKVVNLYIGGCSLETHWKNIEADEAAYDYQLNGQYSGRKISIKNALLEEAWDYVTLQQVSGNSGIFDTYYPFIRDVSAYVKQYAPQAEQLLHQTWAYELDSNHPDFVNYDCDQVKMYKAIIDTYQNVANDLSLRIIPNGKVIQSLRSNPVFDYANGGLSLCRDGFHLSPLYGRYAAAATWYEYILLQSIKGNSFVPPVFDGNSAGSLELNLIQDTVHHIVGNVL